MRKLFFILSSLILALMAAGCHPKEAMDTRYLSDKEEFIRILRTTGRPGMESVILELEKTDFYTRPAGSHHTFKGGLVRHSLETYRIMRYFAWFQSDDSIAIVALFHDMGKIDYGGWHPWRSVKHLKEWGLELSDAEYHAIFYHHKPGLKYYRSSLRRALSLADAVSTGWWKLWH